VPINTTTTKYGPDTGALLSLAFFANFSDDSLREVLTWMNIARRVVPEETRQQAADTCGRQCGRFVVCWFCTSFFVEWSRGLKRLSTATQSEHDCLSEREIHLFKVKWFHLGSI
jgi:hypothetical protein